MNVSLTPELERLINDKVDTGSYQTASEVVREALRLLKLRDEGLVQLRRDVQAGFDQIERGEFAEYTARSASKLGSRVKARGVRSGGAQPTSSVSRRRRTRTAAKAR